MRLSRMLVAVATSALVTVSIGSPAGAEPVPSPAPAGTVSAWGTTTVDGATAVPGDLTGPIADVAVNNAATAAVGVDGSFRVWGTATAGSIVSGAPSGVTNAAAVSMINGDLVQDGSTADLIFDIPALVAHVSAAMTLLPGDVILTGTPEGVGPMEVGDDVEVSIEGLGSLANTVAKR